jgi:regulation of enolase protein 1 (concanavalin A-like superfamily)
MPSFGVPFWINEPPSHREANGALTVVTGKETDWWNNTFYGFKHLSGHFRGTPVTGDFSLTVSFSAPYATLYDQAGAMLRVDDDNWLKCGVEFTDGRKNFSVVVTRDDQSDWSVMPIDGAVGSPVALRLTRHAEALRVEVETDGKFRLVRLAYLRMPETVEAGPMCCSPVGEGLSVTFHSVLFGDPIDRELHD